MPERAPRTNAAKSRVRSCIEHTFAEQKSRMGQVVRTIGVTRATREIGMANLVDDLKRFVFPQKRAVA